MPPRPAATEIDWFNPEARAAMEWTREPISAGDPGLAGRPPAASRSERDFTLVHGSPRDPIWEYVTSRRPGAGEPRRDHDRATGCTATPTSRSPSPRSTAGCETLAPRAGNTVALGEGRTLLNPGSVGQPRDGDPRASYLVLDTEAADRDLGPGRLRHRGRAARDARPPACPPRLADRLRVGA